MFCSAPDVAQKVACFRHPRPGDIDKLSEQLELIITDDVLREELSKESKKLASQKFNLKTVTEEVAEIYDGLFEK